MTGTRSKEARAVTGMTGEPCSTSTEERSDLPMIRHHDQYRATLAYLARIGQ